MGVPSGATNVQYLLYDAAPIAFEMAGGLGINGFQGYAISTLGSTATTQEFFPAPPAGVTWPVNTSLPPPGAYLITGIGPSVASDNPGGGGTVWSVPTTAVIVPHRPIGQPSQVSFTNPTDHQIYLTSIPGFLQRYAVIPVSTNVTPPTQTGPTTTPPPPNLPPSVVSRILLQKANPGFVCELTRLEHYEDLGGVTLGQRANLTAPMIGATNRGHVITIIKHDMVASMSGGSVSWTLQSRVTLERIPGTLLPGTGTSAPAQDANHSGAEVSIYLLFNDSATGFELGGFAA